MDRLTRITRLTRHLAHRQTLRLQGPLDLLCVAGTLWVTVDGRPEDIVLEAGQGARVDGAVVVAYALSPTATIDARLEPQARPTWHQGLRRWAAGRRPLASLISAFQS